jgi:outer membrane receptor protein involved in Fe transport
VTISSRTVNETRGQFTHSNLEALPGDLIGPAVNISGVASFGTSSGSPTGRLNKLYEIANNLSHQSGAHGLRVGMNFLFNDGTITYPRSARGSYTFGPAGTVSALANFLAGVYNNAGFTQTFGNSMIAQSNPNVGFYAQDEWKISPRLTLNGGLRYDLQAAIFPAVLFNWIQPVDPLAESPAPNIWLSTIGSCWPALRSRDFGLVIPMPCIGSPAAS